ncbi:malate dehydrogenase [Rarobacter incanus]|uniref:Malate dehydrogenase n=1 Tax=Rarobacter incanus TaxID=153494 RepID=A0A542SPH7_9MICO|nr:malate dehydrogenase [Rarobacter incanus]
MLGATGDVGRQICAQLIERRVLPPTSRLQLVGRSGGASASATHGLRADLIDAYDEHAPLIDAALRPEDVVADVVVMAAGLTAPARAGGSVDRNALAAANARVFASYADAIARYGSGHEVVIVVSNPVELGVDVVARRLDRHRVIGMGAWLDTLRFRREIAASLGVRRQRVGGFVVGQHGNGAVPLWSSVRIRGLDTAERIAAMATLRGDRTFATFVDEIRQATHTLDDIATLDVEQAFATIDSWPPDLRVVARPWMTHQSGSKTANGTAGAAVDLVDTVLDGRDIVVAGQVRLEGEISLLGSPVAGVLGVPVVLGPEGWRRVLLDPLAADEEALLAASARSIAAVVDSVAATVEPVVCARREEDDYAEQIEWIADVRGADQTGTLTALASVFSSRGVNFESFATLDVADGVGAMRIAFTSSPRLQRVLARTIDRLAVIESVTMRRA